MMEKVRVGVVNTGWWADAMYLPALKAHEDVVVSAVCGRNPEKAAAFASSWDVPNWYIDYRDMLDADVCDAVVVASHTDTHYPITITALQKGLHVLCEKPLAVTVTEAEIMSALADEANVVNVVPFTYRFLPHARYIKQLIDEDYIGTPYHLNIRYYHAFGRNEGYGWGWNADKVGAGDIANLGSHPIYLAMWYFGDIESVTAELNSTINRGTETPDGKPFTPADDNGVLTLRFKNGAIGTVHYSSLSFESSGFGQQHFMEFQGSKGTLYHVNDWTEKQETLAAQEGETLTPLNLPDAVWGHANIMNVHESYKAVFRKDGYMVGEFVDAILGKGIKSRTPLPSFKDGLAVQKVIESAVKSSREGRRISL